MDLCPEVRGEGKNWRFVGIWAKNRYEWTATLLAGMHFNITTVGFYDAQSTEQVDYIVRQTEMTSIVCTEDYAARLVTMRKSDMIPTLKTLIVTNECKPALLQQAQEVGINVVTFSAVLAAGEAAPQTPWVEPTKDDVYILSYTSGTTGDPKGVKLTHNNILAAGRSSVCRVVMVPGETMISYLPLTHSFEQALFAFSLIQQLKIGFFCGDTLKITEDCQRLRPNFFPSVPRLYNKIYAKLNEGLSAATGCKRWLATKAVAAKTANYNANGRVTHGCWDALVFKKMSALLGG